VPRDLLPADVRALKGTRVPVMARNRAAAIAAVAERPWRTRCLNPQAPIFEHGRWWFVLADEPTSGLAELARQAELQKHTNGRE